MRQYSLEDIEVKKRRKKGKKKLTKKGQKRLMILLIRSQECKHDNYISPLMCARHLAMAVLLDTTVADDWTLLRPIWAGQFVP